MACTPPGEGLEGEDLTEGWGEGQFLGAGGGICERENAEENRDQEEKFTDHGRSATNIEEARKNLSGPVTDCN